MTNVSTTAGERAERLGRITSLQHGRHDGIHAGMCVMEAVAYVAGEPWSDAPACACPVISTFMRAWNDALPSDEERTRLLLPLVPRLVGTRASQAVEQRRAVMAADWLIRVHAPAWLRLAKLDSQADLLASLPEITDFAQCPSLTPALTAVRNDAAAARDAAWDATRDATKDAAWDAAMAVARAAARAAAKAVARDAAMATIWDAAWHAAWDVAWDAARAAAWAAARDAAKDALRAAARDAAWAAARDAAWAAARDAALGAAWPTAWDAAGAAARAALTETTQALQQSALGLIERMVDAGFRPAGQVDLGGR